MVYGMDKTCQVPGDLTKSSPAGRLPAPGFRPEPPPAGPQPHIVQIETVCVPTSISRAIQRAPGVEPVCFGPNRAIQQVRRIQMRCTILLRNTE